MFRASLHGGDGDKPGPRGEVEHGFPAHGFGVIENVARKPLTTRPCEGPERGRQADLCKLLLRALPKIVRLIGQMKHDLRHMRRAYQRRVGADERRRIVRGDAPHGEKAQGALSRPPMRQISAHSSGRTGCTESLELLTRIISESFGLALISASVTG